MNKVAIAAKAGDPKAKRALGELMQPFVISYLRTIKGDFTRKRRDDLTQSAWLGVAEALSRWDSSKDVKFNTYAHFWIRGEVNKWLAQNSGVLALPRTAWVDVGKVEAHIRAKYGDDWAAHEIDDDELADIEIATRSEPRYFRSAGDAVRGRQQAFYPDLSNPDWEPSALESAEESYFEESHDSDEDALLAFAIVRDHLDAGDEQAALEAATDFAYTHNLPDEVITNLLKEANNADSI